MFSLEDGDFLVKSARKTIEEYLKTGKVPEIDHNKRYDKKQGVFVTIESFPEKRLRGCIGYPYPVMPLFKAMQDAAVSAASFDPRFTPLQSNDLDKVVIELSILTEPELLQVKRPDDYLSRIEIGKHGLIVKRGPFSGLLLPQVAVEQKWNARQFLENSCWKASLPQDMWMDPNTEVYRFEAQIFAEEKPNGRVVEKTLFTSQKRN